MISDYIELGGYLLATWFCGFGAGFLVSMFRKFTEQI